MHTILNALGSEEIMALILGAVGLVFGFVKRWQFVHRWRLQTAFDAIELGVRQTYETYVRLLKKAREDGKLTDAERREAIRRASDYAIDYAKHQGVDLLKVYSKQLLPVLIDRVVIGKKAPLPFASLPELADISPFAP